MKRVIHPNLSPFGRLFFVKLGVDPTRSVLKEEVSETKIEVSVRAQLI
jgi:hypothetical protein